VVVLLAAVKVGAQRGGGEVLLPQTWGEEMDIKGGMGVAALQHIHQVDIEETIPKWGLSRFIQQHGFCSVRHARIPASEPPPEVPV
jgi:hypothetical protein